MPTLPRRISLVDAAAAMRRGEFDSVALVSECLARIERFEPRVHAWVRVERDESLKQAMRLSDELRRGEDRGLLHGIPIAVKDIVDVAGLPTLAGSQLRAGHVAEADAPVVAGLRATGAVILGKTVTTEFASFDPPPTRNPWNLERTPAGSSSGSAAAVALGMCLAAVGSQTGGSITRPASFCGIAGLKPAYGALSLDGIVPLSPPLDHPGPLANFVRDLGVMYAGMAGRQPHGAGSIPPEPPRLGLLEEFFLTEASDDVRRGVLDSVARLKDAGAAVEIVPLPASFADVTAMHRVLMARGAAEVHRELFDAHREEFGPCVRSLIEEGMAVRPSQYTEALAHQQQFRGDMDVLASRYDALVTPGAVTTAVGIDSTGDPRFNSPWSHAGLPTVSFPCGLASDGLPIALQLIGGLGRLETLLDAAAWCEHRVHFVALPPLLGELP